MPQSFNELFRSGKLQRDAAASPKLAPKRLFSASAGKDELRGKVDRSSGASGGAPRLSRGLDQRLGTARRFGHRTRRSVASGFDTRQRAVVKVHYFGHGGGAGLKAHARYVAREAAALQRDALPGADPDQNDAHSAYLSRSGREPFYDALQNSVDGAQRADEWGAADRRHYRIILAPENGADLKDLRGYTREVMTRVEGALDARLVWIAVDHWDTDNPHTHLILRGRRRDGKPLFLPREFVKHGFRQIARDVATERLGPRSRAGERQALLREARAHRPTRLDAHLARIADANGVIRSAAIKGGGDPALAAALKLRARELARLGLADQVGRNVFQFKSDWRDRLKAMELHLDVRKALMRARTSPTPSKSLDRLPGGGRL